MTERALSEYLSSEACKKLPAGVVTVLFCEDDAYLEATVDHALRQSPAHILAIGRPEALEGREGITAIPADLTDPLARDRILNDLIDRFDGRWLHWLHNGEFFFYPWCESRSLGDLTGFLKNERRSILYTYSLDLYAQDLPAGDPRTAPLWFDRDAYCAFPEQDQQLTVYGGLGWRFEEFFSTPWLEIGRANLFRARKGVHIRRNLIFADPAYRTVSAPWHHSPTGAVMSFRRSRHLMAHPEFFGVRDKLIWSGSEPFRWNSNELLDLGMIEPGQWF
ncbi:hypothetical protein KHP62_12685 [Rhodobacteraceae bacterium NNCM2]|nr:hypothetical protein [Coraliihabitans acroporae]